MKQAPDLPRRGSRPRALIPRTGFQRDELVRPKLRFADLQCCGLQSTGLHRARGPRQRGRGLATASWLGLACAVLTLLACPLTAGAGVVVLSNRTAEARDFLIRPLLGSHQEHRLEPGDGMPLATTTEVDLVFLSKGQRREYRLEVDCVYFFFETPEGEVELQRIGLGGTTRAEVLARDRRRDRPEPDLTQPPLLTVKVKILADDDERAIRKRWEERLRSRIESASEIFERQARIKLDVVEVDTWDTADETTEFVNTLSEFEKEVRLGKAQVAIGFTSQYSRPAGPTKLGGTRGPLHPWILIREWPLVVSEPERLEILVHELGHYFGAVHSPEANSAMRQVLGDGQALAKQFRIGFDPVNTLILYLVADELRNGPVRNYSQMSLPTRLQMRSIYHQMIAAVPNDPSTVRYLARLGNFQLKGRVEDSPPGLLRPESDSPE
jgi:hypothetical protein